MAGYFFAFVACLLASLGARDQVMMAQITLRQGARPALLGVGILSAALCSAAAAWLSTVMTAEVPTIAARMVFAGIALVLSGLEALLLSARRAPEEPTHSLFAALVVLAAQQITDAARFLVLALALVTAAPIPAGLGGAVASSLVLGMAWIAPELVLRREVPKVRRAAGLALLIAGLVLFVHGMN